MYATFNCFELDIRTSDAMRCSRPGLDAHDDIAALRHADYVAAQLGALSPESVRDELRRRGAWSAEELADTEANLERILWIACGDVRDSVLAAGG